MRLWIRMVVVATIALTAGCDDAATVDELPDALDMAAIDTGPDLDMDEADVDQADAALPDAVVDMADAHVPIRAEESPTEGEANLVGAEELTEAVPAGRARAGRVDDAAEALTGIEAHCRVGCFRLDNEVISACIQGAETFSGLTYYGGNLIDAHRADRPGTDEMGELVIAPGLGEVSVDEIGIVRDGSDGGPAIIRTRGRLDGMRLIVGYLLNAPQPITVITEYRLYPGADNIEIWTWYESGERGGGGLSIDFVLFGDQTLSFRAGELLAEDAVQEPATFFAATGKEVSYGWSHFDGALVKTLDLPLKSFPVKPVTHGNYLLKPGDNLLLKRRLTIGTGDVESVRPTLDGAVEVVLQGPAGARVLIDDGTKTITRALLDEAGTRVVHLVPGAYRYRPVGWAGGEQEPTPFMVEAAGEQIIELPAVGQFEVTVVDEEGTPLAAKLAFGDGEARRLEFIDGTGVVELPVGEWRLVATHGFQFSAFDQMIEVEADQPGQIEIVLRRELPFEGWATGDFHQHASPSTDSLVAVRARVLSNLAEGLDFVVPTDHDNVFDYATLAQVMGVDDRLGVPMLGSELSPLVAHFGALGIDYEPGTSAGGSPAQAEKVDGRWRRLTMAELVAAGRAHGAEVMQMNHPRASQGYFDLVGYRPEVALDELDSRDWTTDFDTIEVFNGQGDFCQVFADWMGVLNQGWRITGVGNSDSHLLSVPTAYPRNYLPTGAEVPQAITADEVIAGLREGRVSVGGGAFLDLPDGPLFGDTVDVVDDQLTTRVRVRTPSFAKVHRLLAFHNGIAVLDIEIESATEDLTDFDAEITVPIDSDGPVIFLALGDPHMAYVTDNTVFAFSNPIWVDVDGGGVAPIGPGAIELPQMDICD